MLQRNPIRSTWTKHVAAASSLLLLLGIVAPRLDADDRELLRDNSADPYLFILLDSSMSMSLAIDGTWVEANGSDPRSRIYQAKQVLYELLKDIPNIRYGFSTLNQDQLRVRAKHWLYYVEDPAINAGNAAALTDLQGLLGYPDFEPNNEVEVPVLDADGNPTGDIDVVIDGDMMTFGMSFDTPAAAGSCGAPLQIGNATDRQRINRYSKLGVFSDESTVIWVEDAVSGNTFKLTFSNADTTVVLGADTIDMTIKAEEVLTCVDSVTGRPSFSSSVEHTLTLRRWTQFLMTDDASGEVVFEAAGPGAGNKDGIEDTGGFWDFRDAQGTFSCGSSKPFSGGGWEGNYDTGEPFTTNAAFETNQITSTGGSTELVDTYCTDPTDSSTCDLLHFPTDYDASINRNELDRGDMLPFHWGSDNKDSMLGRLNPNHLAGGAPEYRAAAYFEDVPAAAGEPLRLKAKYRGADAGEPLAFNTSVPNASPIVPAGLSPISDSILDFRCWYTGSDKGGKCGNLESVFTKGFQQLLADNDPASSRCRQPYLIIISDLANNCPGSSSVSKVAGFNSETRDGNITATGVSTWVLNVGTGKSNALTNAGKGESIDVTSKDNLRDVLKDIIGIIQESTRSFSSAAVPSVQADVEEKIYVTQFVPRANASVWEGHVHAFLKPLPTAPVDSSNPAAGVAPDVNHENHLWDAAFVLSSQQAPRVSDLTFPLDRSELRIGDVDESSRRLFYAIGDSDPFTDADADGVNDNDTDGKVPRTKNIFGPVEGSPPPGMDLNHVRKDLWVGMEVIPEDFVFQSLPDGSDLQDKHEDELRAAHRVFERTYAIKEVLKGDGSTDTVEYVLGDIFHATPLLVGSPSNSRYLSRAAPGDDFEGYAQFFQMQQRRRKVLFVASNDGQLHAFEAGRFQGSIEDGAFCDVEGSGGQTCAGGGTELFAYTPREAMRTLRDLAGNSNEHQWGIDGTPVAADVKIDSRHEGRGSSKPPVAEEREWRTVLVGGMRRGGSTVYALDITSPDKTVDEQQSFLSVDVSLGFRPEQDPSPIMPSCMRLSSGDPASVAGSTAPNECDPLGYSYPEILWEFTDPDMGGSWSTPDVGAIRVLENGEPATRFVAIFGGGFDPERPSKGQNIYIVDVETGKMLYKRHVFGPIAAPSAAVDRNQDGFLDTIYMGTTRGIMYKVDIEDPQAVVTGASCTATPPAGSTDSCCASAGGPTNGCVIDSAWEPVAIFDTETPETDSDGNSVLARKPIFFAPSVLFVAQLNTFALGFGTGNRDNLWAAAPPGGNRFYLFVDDSELLSPVDLPRFEDDFTEVTSPVGVENDLLGDPSLGDGERGWFMKLGTIAASDPEFDVVNEKVLTPSTAVAGLTTFATFVPETKTTETGTGQNREIRCARRGISRVFNQFASNGTPIPTPDPSDPSAELSVCETPPCDRVPDEVSTLVSEPFIEEARESCPGTEGMAELLMKQLFPPNCKFGPYRWNLSAMRADTGVECFAQIPVCIVEQNWKDF